MLRDRLAGEFILDVIYDSFWFSYDCVTDEEWNETIFALLATDFPCNIREVYERWLIGFVLKQARVGKWDDVLMQGILEEQEKH